MRSIVSYSRIVEHNFGITVKAFVREEPKGHAIQYIPLPVEYRFLHIEKDIMLSVHIKNAYRNRKISLNMYRTAFYIHIIYVYIHHFNIYII